METAPRAIVLRLGPVLVGVALCFFWLDKKSIWGDEAFSIALAREGWGERLGVIVDGQANMSLYYVLLGFWIELGESEFAVRSLSALAASLAVGAVYAVGARLFRPVVGFLAASMLALNAFFVHYGQEARAYSLALLLVTVSTLLFLRAATKASERAWAAYAIVAGLSLYAHVFAAFVVVAHLVSLPFVGSRAALAREAALAYGAIALLAAPLGVALVAQESRQLDWVPEPSLGGVADAVRELAGGNRAVLLAYVVLGGLGLLAAHRERRRGAYVLLLLWLLVPILGSLAVSLVKPIFVPRYLIVCLPPIVLLAANGLASIRVRWLAAGLALVLVVFSGRALGAWYAGTEKEHQDWRVATQRVLEASRPGDAIVFYRPSRYLPFSYYLRERDREAGMPEPLYPTSQWGEFDLVHDYRSLRPSQDWDRLLQAAREVHPRLWIVRSPSEPVADQRRESRRLRLAAVSRYGEPERIPAPGVAIELYRAAR